MSIQSMLAVLNSGTSSLNVPTAYYVGGATPTQLGDTFATVQITITGGSFAPGDTLTADNGGTAIVTQFIATSIGPRGNVLPDRLIVRNMSIALPFSQAVTISGSGGGTANVVLFEGIVSGINNGAVIGTNNCLVWNNQVYIYNYVTIYKYDVINNYWVEGYRIDTNGVGSVVQGRYTGLFTVVITNTEYLSTMYTDGNNIAVLTADGITWTETDLGTSFSILPSSIIGSTVPPQALNWRNDIYILSGDFGGAAELLKWQTSTNLFTNIINTPGGDINTACLIVCQNRLFILMNTGGVWGVWELTTGTFVHCVDLVGTGVTAPGRNARPTGFIGPDNTSMYFLYLDNDGVGTVGGVFFAKVTFAGNIFTATNLTGVDGAGSPTVPALLPSPLYYGNLAPTFPGFFTTALETWTDTISNAQSGGPLINHIWISYPTGTAGIRYYYTFTNDSTPLVSSDSGTSIQISMVKDVHGGGERSWFPGEVTVEIVSGPTTVPSVGEQLGFKLYPPAGTPSVANVTFSMQYGLEGQAPITLATLTNPSAGTVANPGPVFGNQITGLTADGTTTYYVTWAAQSQDGVGNFVRVQRAPVAIAP